MHVITAEDTLDALSAKYNVPACMLMRKNRIFSAAWLVPGREIEIPETSLCEHSDFPCPVLALTRPAKI